MVKYVSVALSDELHTRFKNYCTNHNLPMKVALTLAVQIIINKKDIKN